MIFQEPMTSLNPLHTIGRQVAEVLTLHRGLPKRQALIRAQELLEMVALGDTAKRLKAFPHELSGGQRQRVMIAMALACEPDLLDRRRAHNRPRCHCPGADPEAALGELQQRLGMAMLLITHDLSIVRHIADRVCVMRDGVIVEAGATETRLRERPNTTYTRALIESEPKGEPLAVEGEAEEVVACDDLKIHFPIKAGVLRHTVGHVKAVDGVTLSIREGQTIGIRRRERLRQDHSRAGAAAADFERGSHRLRGPLDPGAHVQAHAPAAGGGCRSSSRTPSAPSARA